MRRLLNTATGLWSLLAGLAITARQIFSPKVTTYYPRQTVVPEEAATFHGPIELVGLPDNPAVPRCISCMLCVQACPSGCIAVTRSPTPKPTPEEEAAMKEAEARGEKVKKPAAPKNPTRWDYDFSLCSLCGSCIEVCPVKSIAFSHDIYLAGTGREDFHLDLLAKLARKAHATPAPGEGES